MAVLHGAWTFRPTVAHAAIAEAVVRDGAVDQKLLLEFSRSAVREAPPSYLEMIRFDPEWHVDPDYGSIHHYVLALGAFLRSCPTIRRPRLLESHLHALLWPGEEARRVVEGDALSTLDRVVDDPLMAWAKSKLTSQFGGWLHPRDIRSLLQELKVAERGFVAPTGEELTFSFGRTFDRQVALIDLADTYASALECLGAAVSSDNDLALRCIVD